MAQPLHISSPDEIQGDGHIFLDTNFLIAYVFKKEDYQAEAQKLLAEQDKSFVIDSFQEKCLRDKKFGKELDELAGDIGPRLSIVSCLTGDDFKTGRVDGGIRFLYEDLIHILGEFSEKVVSDPRWVMKRIERFKPPQFKAINKDSFGHIDREDVFRFISAAYYGIPLLISEDAHMRGISLITEVRRPVYESRGITVPYILHPGYVFSDADKPRVDYQRIKKEVNDWHTGLTRRRPRTGNNKDKMKITARDFIKANEGEIPGY